MDTHRKNAPQLLLSQVLMVLLALLMNSGCGRGKLQKIQGYVEGEFVYIASPLAGKLQSLAVSRGKQIDSGASLFVLESVAEEASRDEISKRLMQAQAELRDSKKGRRLEEIQSLEAQLGQARALLTLSEREFARQKKLFQEKTVAEQDYDRARARNDQDRQHVTQLEAELALAKLGARSDVIASKEANVQSLEAQLRRAEWELEQKRQSAPKSGVIIDTLYREGEWVPAGKPVVVLLPPSNIKVRVFVPQAEVSKLELGDPATVHVDGLGQEVSGTISFISPRTEFTPPVIFSQQNRIKLVFLVEVAFEGEVAAKLHPGQPVDVDF